MPKHTESAVVGGEAVEIGCDPRRVTVAEFAALGHCKRPLLDAIRQNCIECCMGNQAEVRRCRLVACPMWPYRMGTNPFVKRELTEEQRARAREQLAGARRAAAP
jgi:hypothetical protein